MKITRAIIADLWPLCVSGDASPDSRALVEEFLEGDPEFARSLRDSGGDPLSGLGGTPPPDHELRSLALAKRRLSGYPWLRFFAVLWTSFAFGRIISDTSWDVSPRNFLITAGIAACFWVAHYVSLVRGRRAVFGSSFRGK
jgi:hypothetical protein